jgi:hypothetical protein
MEHTSLLYFGGFTIAQNAGAVKGDGALQKLLPPWKKRACFFRRTVLQ